jgi:hypothetical protein
VGWEHTSRRTIDVLLRWALISMDSHSVCGKYEFYELNSYGRRALDHEAEVLQEIHDIFEKARRQTL